jgi:hypothetical protein
MAEDQHPVNQLRRSDPAPGRRWVGPDLGESVLAAFPVTEGAALSQNGDYAGGERLAGAGLGAVA